jgi:hypothetical protein
MELLAISTPVEGSAAVISAFVLFCGSVLVLLAAIFGLRMGYLMMATGFFGFMIILSALWSFGAPGTPAFLGPKGELAHWEAAAAGVELRSDSYPVVNRYPGDPWKSASSDPSLSAEVEAASIAFTEFLAEEANQELRRAGVEGEITPENFEVEDVRFTTAPDGTQLTAARAFSTTGGPEVTVIAFMNTGNLSLPSYLFLIGSLIGFAVHLPFLDRAEKKRKEILTGGEQSPWRGPA